MTGRAQHANPLSEIALAMAMAFFCIMVVALISMGGIVTDRSKPESGEISQYRISKSTPVEVGRFPKRVAKSALLIFYENNFLNSSLEVVQPASWQPDGHPVLAFAPTVKLSEIVEVKALIPIADITITSLDERWLKRLKELKQ